MMQNTLQNILAKARILNSMMLIQMKENEMQTVHALDW